MVDPTPLLDSLLAHVQAKIGHPINNGPLQRQLIKPDAAEFAVTAITPGAEVASGGTHAQWLVEGYFALHVAPATTPAALVLRATGVLRALNTWWKDPVPQNEPGLLDWTVDPANLFANPLTNSAGGTSVLTVEVGFTLLLDLEVA